MRFILIVLTMAGFCSATTAQQKAKITKLNLTALATQEIEMNTGLSLNRACEVLGPPRIAVITPPKNGKVTEIHKEFHSSYKKENPRFPCNSKKSMGVVAIYKSNENFKGTEKLKFSIVYYDGAAEIYDVTITVWR